MNFLEADNYFWARLIFERALGVIFFVAFLSAYNQFRELLGDKGLLPVPEFLKRVSFKDSPSLFHWKYSDKLLRYVCLLGMAVSLGFTFGILGQAPILIHMLSWLLVYFLYLSIVNVGQIFYGFGWETMILEAGFFAAFMGPEGTTPSWIPIIILRWMLFRTEMGAGLIKLRGDKCWQDLTCLYYHHETQPLPNPLSRYFHHAPKFIHRFGEVFSHFCQLGAPLLILMPQPLAAVGGFFLISHQLILIVSGNYSWLNWLTIILTVLTFSDPPSFQVNTDVAPLWFQGIQFFILLMAITMSYKPLLNLFSKNQFMNYCWNRWHLVGAYGAFGSVTKERYEIVIEGCADEFPNSMTEWKEYGFKGKPVELDRVPPIVAPYHLRLDWMIWFLPFSVMVGENEIYVRGHDRWFINLVIKLLENDTDFLKLFRKNPFVSSPPNWIRAKFYKYHFTTKEEKKETGNIWKRRLIGDYCPEISLEMIKKI